MRKKQSRTQQSSTLSNLASISSSSSVSFKDIQIELSREKDNLRNLEEKILLIHEEINKFRDSDLKDELERIIAEDNQKERVNVMRRLTSDQAALMNNISQLEKLLAVATPAIKSLVGNSKAISTSDSALIDKPSIFLIEEATSDKVIVNDEITNEVENNQLQEKIIKTDLTNLASNLSNPSRTIITNFNNQEKEDFSNSDNILSTIVENQNSAEKIEKKVKKKVVVSSNNLAKKAVHGPVFRPPSASSEASLILGPSNVLEGGEMVWTPPLLQTGDGKTSLNLKFGY
jgi:hypothetical protein